jgi:hypothetical protein
MAAPVAFEGPSSLLRDSLGWGKPLLGMSFQDRAPAATTLSRGALLVRPCSSCGEKVPLFRRSWKDIPSRGFGSVVEQAALGRAHEARTSTAVSYSSSAPRSSIATGRHCQVSRARSVKKRDLFLRSATWTYEQRDMRQHGAAGARSWNGIPGSGFHRTERIS